MRLPGSRYHPDGSRAALQSGAADKEPPWSLCPTPPPRFQSEPFLPLQVPIFYGKHHPPFQRLASTPPPVRMLHPNPDPSPSAVASPSLSAFTGTVKFRGRLGPDLSPEAQRRRAAGAYYMCNAQSKAYRPWPQLDVISATLRDGA